MAGVRHRCGRIETSWVRNGGIRTHPIVRSVTCKTYISCANAPHSSNCVICCLSNAVRLFCASVLSFPLSVSVCVVCTYSTSFCLTLTTWAYAHLNPILSLFLLLCLSFRCTVSIVAVVFTVLWCTANCSLLMVPTYSNILSFFLRHYYRRP